MGTFLLGQMFTDIHVPYFSSNINIVLQGNNRVIAFCCRGVGLG
jgi:hypothetical protein